MVDKFVLMNSYGGHVYINKKIMADMFILMKSYGRLIVYSN